MYAGGGSGSGLGLCDPPHSSSKGSMNLVNSFLYFVFCFSCLFNIIFFILLNLFYDRGNTSHFPLCPHKTY